MTLQQELAVTPSAKLAVRNVSKTFRTDRGSVHALDRVTLNVSDGEFVCLVGPSGCGKSTLLNLIAGLERPDGGRLTLDGVDYSTLDDDALTQVRREKMGFVFQAFHVLPHLTVGQNVALPLWLQGMKSQEAEGPAQQLLDAVGLGERSASWPRELSGGEMQRVAIARALVHRPSLVLADEPTGNLDPANGAKVLRLLGERVREAGAIGILVTHSLEAAATADRILHLTAEGLVT